MTAHHASHHRVSVEADLRPPPTELTQDIANFLRAAQGSVLKAWLQHFDLDFDHVVTKHEFMRGMSALGYQGNSAEVFERLDHDHAGCLSISDLDPNGAATWAGFREWCAVTFSSPDDMFVKLHKHKLGQVKPLTSEDFNFALRRLGWDGGSEQILFEALDSNQEGKMTQQNLRWLSLEIKRRSKKVQAKQRCTNQLRTRMHNQVESEALLFDFKRFLKRKYGGYVHAWRKGLSPNDSMFLQKAHFFIGCQNVGWTKNVQLLWAAFDKDNSGEASIDELDLREAEILARFSAFIKDNFGNAAAAFRALDRGRLNKLSHEHFAVELKRHGLTVPTKQLFHGLDKNGTKSLNAEDLQFLDKWKPVEFLLKEADNRAAEDLMYLLVQEYKSLIKAWRNALDTDNSNRCNWYEFKAACEKIRFKGDLGGAWRALDANLAGFITLREIDEPSYASLLSFRKWADEEFGGVRSAFSVFDTTGSNQVTYQEFLQACRVYGFIAGKRALKTIFSAFDHQGTKQVCRADVAFLDSWNISSHEHEDSNNYSGEIGDTDEALKQKSTCPMLSSHMERLARPRNVSAAPSPTPTGDHPENKQPNSKDPLRMYRSGSSPSGRGAAGAAMALDMAALRSRYLQESPPTRRVMNPTLHALAKQLWTTLLEYRDKSGKNESIPQICNCVFEADVENDSKGLSMSGFNASIRRRLRLDFSREEIAELWQHLSSQGSREVTTSTIVLLMNRVDMCEWPDLSSEELHSCVYNLDLAAQRRHGKDIHWAERIGTTDKKGKPRISLNAFSKFVQSLASARAPFTSEITHSQIRGLWKALDQSCEMEVPLCKLVQFVRKHCAKSYPQQSTRSPSPSPRQTVATDIEGAPRLSDEELRRIASRLVSSIRSLLVPRPPSDSIGVVSPQVLGQVLDMIDVDDRGYLSLFEIDHALKKASQECTETELKAFWRAVDTARRGEVSASDFCNVLYKYQLMTWPTPARGDLERVVDILNKKMMKYHHSGIEGWYKVFLQCNMRTSVGMDFEFMTGLIRNLFPCLNIGPREISDSDIQGLWRSIDVNASGSIPMDALLRFMKKYSRTGHRAVQHFPTLPVQKALPKEQVLTKLWKQLDRL